MLSIEAGHGRGFGAEVGQVDLGAGLGCRGHSRSPLLPLPAAAGAPLASHAVEGGDDEEQEAHADGHGHDGDAGLGGLGGHCGDRRVGARSSSPGHGPVPPGGHSRGPKWKTCWALPWALEASQETPRWLMALVSFRVRELLTQPWPPGTGSVDCGGSGQAWAHGIEGWGEGKPLRK